jgi:uncharacterized protein YchJ
MSSNCAIHEAFHQDINENVFHADANVSIRKIFELIKEIHDSETVYQYTETDAHYFGLEQITYEAMINNDAEAQYYLAKEIMMRTDKSLVIEDSFKKAHLLFSIASKTLPKAEYELAIFIYKGLHCTKDTKKAINIFKRLAKEGLTKAIISCTEIYLHEDYGSLITKDETIQFLKIAMGNGSLQSHVYMGKILELDGDYYQAYLHYKYSSLRDDNDAKLNIAKLFLSNRLTSNNGEITPNKHLNNDITQESYAVLYHCLENAYESDSAEAGVLLAELHLKFRDDEKRYFNVYETSLKKMFSENKVDQERYNYYNFNLLKYKIFLLDSEALYKFVNWYSSASFSSKLNAYIANEFLFFVPNYLESIKTHNKALLLEHSKFTTIIFLTFNSDGSLKNKNELMSSPNSISTQKKMCAYTKTIRDKNGPTIVIKGKERNQLCACGSGKKFKRCCGLKI